MPHNYENYLKKFYGDYKKIPNLDYIKTHQHTSFYDVEKDYTFYIKK